MKPTNAMIESVRLSDDFIIQEFIPKEVYDIYGIKSAWFIDIRLVNICQYLRDHIGKPITINNWFSGGSYNDSGFRVSGVGASMSQHKYGRAADLKVKDLTPEEVHAIISEKWNVLKKLGLTTLENASKTPTWTHIDLRFTGMDSIFFV